MRFNFSATLENPISHHKLLMFLICKHQLDVLRSMKHLRGKHTISINITCCFVLVSLIGWSNLFVFPQFSLRGCHLYPLERTVWHSTAQEKKRKTQTKHGGIKKRRRPNLNKSLSVWLKQQLYVPVMIHRTSYSSTSEKILVMNMMKQSPCSSKNSKISGFIHPHMFKLH